MNKITAILIIMLLAGPGASLGFDEHFSGGNTNSSFYSTDPFKKPILAAEAIARLKADEDKSVKAEDGNSATINVLPENKRIEKPVSTGYSTTDETDESDSRKETYTGLAKFIRLVARISEEIINAPIMSISIATDWRLDTASSLYMEEYDTAASVFNVIVKHLTG